MAEKDANADRLERLIASQEVMANAINRLVQVLERKERKQATRKTPVARKAVKRPAVVSERAVSIARAQLARLGIKE